ncbi:sensor histidine kinase [Paenibacillus sp. YN15]|uniref:sensor histidine kinase n=1 Tax=Paenibacillus sp. YN15 TaxID=1742774 RepID=UPI000DCD3BDC|nr:sensor histidine kinase [Paenibacillus sp. YN15]RAV04047.1 hypothetical protein DQG13_06085 [Paenibacillus sp. YN15]
MGVLPRFVRHHLLRMKLSAKMFWMSFILVETIFLSLGAAYRSVASGVLEQAQRDYAIQMAVKSNEYLEISLRNIRSLFVSLANDSRMADPAQPAIQTWLNENLTYLSAHARNLHIVENGQVTVSTSRAGWMLLDDTLFREGLESVLEYSPIYWTAPYSSPVSGFTVTGVIRISANGAGETAKYLAIDLDLDKLYQAMQPDAPAQFKGELVLLDAESKPVYGRRPFTAYDVFERQYVPLVPFGGLFEGNWSSTDWQSPEGNRFFITRSNSNMLKWQAVWLMDRTELLRPLQALTRFSWVLAAFSVFLSLVVSLLISKSVSQPIRRIATSMDQVSQGRFDVSIPIKRQDELGLLARHFNQMTRQIATLIDNLKATEEKKTQFELKALHAQIKPHFLFNTLNAISISARAGELIKVDSLISALTNQLDYSLKESTAPVTFREELAAMVHYVELMKIRYGGRFLLECDPDPATLSCRLPKFVLQPLVENAIFHGLAPGTETGILFVGSSFADGRWKIQIEDNGAGMAPETLLRLKRQLEHDHEPDEKTGIGLMNVHQRFRLLFGGDYSMSLDSWPKAGTRILIELPVWTDRESLTEGS